MKGLLNSSEGSLQMQGLIISPFLHFWGQILDEAFVINSTGKSSIHL